MTTTLRGLTWDHPRGYRVLDQLSRDAANGDAAVVCEWDRQTLEQFESRPLREIADDYDVVVIDHPCLGEATADSALQPLDELFDAEELAALDEMTVGRSFASYSLKGHQWALPLDAATQVSVVRADHDERPGTWEDACAAARRTRTALSLGGPHALLTFASICVALGQAPGKDPEAFVDRFIGFAAWQILGDLAAHSEPALLARNPIAVLDAMALPDGPAYSPLVYGYVTYSRARSDADQLIAFDAPKGPGGIGSVLGGTGIAVSASASDDDAVRTLLRELVSDRVQVGVYTELGGQSAVTAAWTDAAVDAACGGFYVNTRATMEAAWIRPRFAGYVEFQAVASSLLRDGVVEGKRPDQVLEEVDAAWRQTQTWGVRA